jgi:hypothetical protein
MSIEASPIGQLARDAGRNGRHVGPNGNNAVAAVEIDVRGRWDALDLSELLVPFHSFLVQHTHERWVVHARAPGCHGKSLATALSAIEGWLAERGLEDAPVRVGGLPYGDRQ